MLRAEGQGERLSRAAAQPVWRDPETGYLRRQVFSRPDHPVELVRVELPAKQSVTLPASSYAHIRQAGLECRAAASSSPRAACATCSPPAIASASARRRTPPLPTRPMPRCTYVVALARS